MLEILRLSALQPYQGRLLTSHNPKLEIPF
jgi:hypothetical protein